MGLGHALALAVALAIGSSGLAPSALAASHPTPARSRGTVTDPAGLVAGHNPRDHVAGEIIVGYDRAITAPLRRRTWASVGRARRPLLGLGADVVELERGLSVHAALEELEDVPGVRYAEPNYVYETAATIPNDPRFRDLWALHNTGQSGGTADADIDAPEAWDIVTGSGDVSVAVVDSGVAYDHPDLASNMWTNPGESGAGKEDNGIDDDGNGYVDDWHGWDWSDDDDDPADLIGHGTHVAGTIGAAGNNGAGVTGINWDVSLMALRVLGADGTGTSSDVAAAFGYARAKGVKVVNVSFGGPDFSQAVYDAMAAAPSTLFVAAAGNAGADNDSNPMYPCNLGLDNVVCVGATDRLDRLAGYSNYGAATVDLAAPGSSILSTVPAFSTPASEGFESELAPAWVTGGTGIAWGRGSDAVGYFAADSPAGNYADNSDTWLATAAPYDLTGKRECHLDYWMSLATESQHDFLSIDASSDGASWTTLVSWTGSTAGAWSRLTQDLSRYEGGPLSLRFRLTSDGATTLDGASIDDVRIRCLSNAYLGTEYSTQHGTSMAAPHVSGAAALLWSAKPSATVADVRGAVLGGADPLGGLSGKTATGGRLNVYDALTLLAPDLIPATGNGSDGSGAGGGGAGGTTEPSPEPTPDATPEPTPDATPDPQPSTEPPGVVTHERTITLTLRRHLVAMGRVSVPDGYRSCIADVVVTIKRNGVVIKRLRSDDDGSFRTRLPDRRGRYVATTPAFDAAALDRCAASRSVARSHQH